jgi:hypothetical protein
LCFIRRRSGAGSSLPKLPRLINCFCKGQSQSQSPSPVVVSNLGVHHSLPTPNFHTPPNSPLSTQRERSETSQTKAHESPRSSNVFHSLRVFLWATFRREPTYPAIQTRRGPTKISSISSSPVINARILRSSCLNQVGAIYTVCRYTLSLESGCKLEDNSLSRKGAAQP